MERLKGKSDLIIFGSSKLNTTTVTVSKFHGTFITGWLLHTIIEHYADCTVPPDQVVHNQTVNSYCI